MNMTTLGIDLAKNVFQLHGTNDCGKKVFGKRVSREKFAEAIQQIPKNLIGMEACGSAHYWARKFTQMGHTVQLMSPQYVKPYVKTNKNDRNDAEAICEAVTRPTMRFVPIKTVEQQDIQLLHTVRTKIIKDKVALGNQIRGLLMEYGVAIPQGDSSLKKALADLPDFKNSDLTAHSLFIFNELYTEFLNLELRIEDYTKKLVLISKQNEHCKSLMSIPGIGEITATALVSSMPDNRDNCSDQKNSYWKNFCGEIKTFKVNFKNCLLVVGRSLVKLLCAVGNEGFGFISNILKGISRVRQRIRPGRHSPRQSRKLINKWKSSNGIKVTYA